MADANAAKAQALDGLGLDDTKREGAVKAKKEAEDARDKAVADSMEAIKEREAFKKTAEEANFNK